MKKVFGLLIVLFLFNCLQVNAECQEYKIRSLAEKVNIRYNLVEEDYYYFDLIFSNLDESIIVTSKNNPSFTISGMDGKTNHIEKIYGIDQIMKTTFQVFALDQSCVAGTIREIEITLPKYNELANTEFCQKNPQKSGCQKLIFIDNKDSYSNMTKIDETITSTSSSEIIGDNQNINPLYIIGAVLIVGSGATFVFLIARKKRRII